MMSINKRDPVMTPNEEEFSSTKYETGPDNTCQLPMEKNNANNVILMERASFTNPRRIPEMAKYAKGMPSITSKLFIFAIGFVPFD